MRRRGLACLCIRDKGQLSCASVEDDQAESTLLCRSRLTKKHPESVPANLLTLGCQAHDMNRSHVQGSKRSLTEEVLVAVQISSVGHS